jgi:hypothetical protein
MKLDIKRFIKECYGRMMIPVCVSIMLGLTINGIICDNGWLIFAGKGILVGIIYLVAVYIIGFSKTEKNQILRMFKRS